MIKKDPYLFPSINSKIVMACRNPRELSWVIKGWWHRFGSVVYGRLFQELSCHRRWRKCKQMAVDNTFYRFQWHHPLITQFNGNQKIKINVVPSIFMKFWSRINLDKLDRLTPKDVWYLPRRATINNHVNINVMISNKVQTGMINTSMCFYST